MFRIIQKAVYWFAQINWLVSIWLGTLDINGLIAFCLRITLLLIINLYFLRYYFRCILYVVSKKTPRNFIDTVRAISRLFIFSFGKTSGISSFLLGLWENEYLFFFFTISESLLEINHSLILCNSLFTLRKISIYILGWVEKICAINKHNRYSAISEGNWRPLT